MLCSFISILSCANKFDVFLCKKTSCFYGELHFYCRQNHLFKFMKIISTIRISKKEVERVRERRI